MANCLKTTSRASVAEMLSLRFERSGTGARAARRWVLTSFRVGTGRRLNENAFKSPEI
jgi:hypothetical protein